MCKYFCIVHKTEWFHYLVLSFVLEFCFFLIYVGFIYVYVMHAQNIQFQSLKIPVTGDSHAFKYHGINKVWYAHLVCSSSSSTVGLCSCLDMVLVLKKLY